MAATTLNETSSFYTGDSPSLFWEMTVCQSLADPASSSAGALVNPLPYGALLGGYLSSRIDPETVRNLVEIGGGYGTLMAALHPFFNPDTLTMVDLSQRFSAIQAERLGGLASATFVNADVFGWLSEVKGDFDLVVANEFLGDLDTVVLEERPRKGCEAVSPEGRAARLIESYGLEVPSAGGFALNVGALELVENLSGRARHVFLSEHSCSVRCREPYDFLVPLADGLPRRIALKDHDEYSIDFNALERVARVNGFEVERVWMPELLGVRTDAGARFMALAECVGNDGAENIHEFLNHVKEYECALLTAL